MIPLQLKLSGFLSYRHPADIDFSTFNLACISGQNGAGKSSLLDAFTWVLFGEARKRGEELINSASHAAEVTLTFSYEGNNYRIQRSLARGKSAVLELQIEDADHWRPLTEASLRATQARIQNILRLDYDTFVNASFFLQGKADQFTQQKASERKRILGSILGLEIWEIYKARAAERRRGEEATLHFLDGRLDAIHKELNETDERRARLKELETQLQQIESARASQEALLKQAEKIKILLDAQHNQVEMHGATLERSRRERDSNTERLAARQAESAHQADLVKRAAEIESRYHAWQTARADLAQWESVAGQFRAVEKRRQPFLDAINAEQAKLEQEKQSLGKQSAEVSAQKQAAGNLQTEIAALEKALLEVEDRQTQRAEVELKLREEREHLIEMEGENKRLKLEMDELKERLDQLAEIEGATCPLCGQPLTGEHRASLLEQLQAEGTEKGDRWRANKNNMEAASAGIKELEAHLKALAGVENERVKLTAQASSLAGRLETATKAAEAWQAGGEKRLAEVEGLLNGSSFGLEARSNLSNIESELAALGYDLAAHEAVRRAEQQGRTAENEFRDLEAARAALAPLEREMGELRAQVEAQTAEIDRQEEAYAQAVVALQTAEAEAPDLQAAEREFYNLKEQESALNQQVGMAQQRVSVLENLRDQKKQVEAEREACALEIGRYKTLERAFGKDGVPALLIEQALPQIEEKANELLSRLSDGTMSVRFVTQAGYKDKKREDMKETLDIQISDGAGARDYEMFSGGEAFRVNFAIRLALSEVLAQRTGARLQTLVIDEGFGSQDALGRQRLVEAINTVHQDFEKILIVTHLDELKEAFPNRIEVEKTPQGSSVAVI